MNKTQQKVITAGVLFIAVWAQAQRRPGMVDTFEVGDTPKVESKKIPSKKNQVDTTDYFLIRDPRELCEEKPFSIPTVKSSEDDLGLIKFIKDYYENYNADPLAKEVLTDTRNGLKRTTFLNRLKKLGQLTMVYEKNTADGRTEINKHVHSGDIIIADPNYGDHGWYVLYFTKPSENKAENKAIRVTYNGLGTNHSLEKKDNVQLSTDENILSKDNNIFVFRPYVLARWEKYDICGKNITMSSEPFCSAKWRKNYLNYKEFNLSLCYHHCLEVSDSNKRKRCLEENYDGIKWDEKSVFSGPSKAEDFLEMVNEFYQDLEDITEKNHKQYVRVSLDRFLPQVIEGNEMYLSCMKTLKNGKKLCLHKINHRFFFVN